MASLCLKATRFLLRQMLITSNSTNSCNHSYVTLASKCCGADGAAHYIPGEVPIIVLHSFLGSKKDWEPLSKKLAHCTRHPIVAVDARNHGESPHMPVHDHHYMARDIHTFLKNSLGVSDAMMIGHGMGGRTAMYLALAQPLTVRNLVVVDASPIITDEITCRKHYFQRVLDAMGAVEFGAKDIEGGISEAKYRLSTTGLTYDEDIMNQIIASNVIKREDNTIGWGCNLGVLYNNLDSILGFPFDILGKKYYGPTMFIAGQYGDLRKEDLNKIRDYFPKAELKLIEGVGHNVHRESPQVFMKHLCEFYHKNPASTKIKRYSRQRRKIF